MGELEENWPHRKQQVGLDRAFQVAFELCLKDKKGSDRQSWEESTRLPED